MRNVIKIPLKSLPVFLCCKITNIAQWLGAQPPGPALRHARVASVCLAHGLNYTIFMQKKTTFVSPLFSKILVARLAAFIAVDRVFKRLQQSRNKGGRGSRRGSAPQTKISTAQTPKQQWKKILIGVRSLL